MATMKYRTKQKIISKLTMLMVFGFIFYTGKFIFGPTFSFSTAKIGQPVETSVDDLVAMTRDVEGLPDDHLPGFNDEHIKVVVDHTGRNVRAKGTIKTGEYLARAPFDKCISLQSALNSTIGSVLKELFFLGLNENEVMVTHIQYEFLLGKKSDWWPYLEVFPTHPGNGIYFTERELDEMQDPQLKERILKAEIKLQKQYKETSSVLTDHFPNLFPKEVYTYNFYKWANVAFWSRYFNTKIPFNLPSRAAVAPAAGEGAVEGVGEEAGTGARINRDPLPPRPYEGTELHYARKTMVPLMDLINHGAVYPHCNDIDDGSVFQWSKEHRTYTLVTPMQFTDNEPVVWCYNEFANRQLLQDYGFSLPLEENQWEKLIIDISSGHGVVRLSFGKIKTSNHKGTFVLRAKDFLTKEDKENMIVRFIETFDCDETDDTCDLIAISLRLIEEMQSRYITTMEYDRELLLEGDGGDRLKEIGRYGLMVVRYRYVHKQLVHNLHESISAFRHTDTYKNMMIEREALLSEEEEEEEEEEKEEDPINEENETNEEK